MAVDLLGGHAVSSSPAAAGEYLAFEEAAAAGLRSLELLASSFSPRADRGRPPPPLARIADQTVSRFRRVINLLDRTGHARFRRAPVAVATHEADSDSGSLAAASPPRPAPALPPTAVSQKSLTLDFTKPAASSATSTSFLSSVTAAGGEGSVSKGQGQTLAAVSSGKPPLPKRKHPCTAAAAPNAAAAAAATTAHPACHCSRKRRKHPRGATRTVRVPAPSPANSASRAAATTTTDVPADEYSWRKYGQKPIKGSPFPRGYYRCSTVKGCPARKHVERDAADPATMLVTYEGDHRHDALAAGAAPGLA